MKEEVDDPATCLGGLETNSTLRTKELSELPSLCSWSAEKLLLGEWELGGKGKWNPNRPNEGRGR